MSDKENLIDLKKRMVMSGISRMDFADRMGIRYNTLSSYLNRTATMPEHVGDEIEEIIKGEDGYGK